MVWLWKYLKVNPMALSDELDVRERGKRKTSRLEYQTKVTQSIGRKQKVNEREREDGKSQPKKVSSAFVVGWRVGKQFNAVHKNFKRINALFQRIFIFRNLSFRDTCSFMCTVMCKGISPQTCNSERMKQPKTHLVHANCKCHNKLRDTPT